MSTQEIASRFTDLCKEGKFEAAQRFWSDDVVSIEAAGREKRLEGRGACAGKGKDWAAHNTLHAVSVEGPYVNGDQFTLRFEMEVTPEGKPRTTMSEVALYTVKNDKVVEERFFYGS